MKQRKFAIVTDSGCDLSKDYLKEHDVFCVPLGFTFDGVNYGGDDGETMPTDEFYERLKKGGMPTTYQATPESVKGVLEPVLADGKDVLAVSFSSGERLSSKANIQEIPCGMVLVGSTTTCLSDRAAAC